MRGQERYPRGQESVKISEGNLDGPLTLAASLFIFSKYRRVIFVAKWIKMCVRCPVQE
jgi:hypothetical protein